MKKSILLIGYKEHFIFNVIKSGLERENFTVKTLLLSAQEGKKDPLPALRLIILDKELIANAQLLSELNREAVASKARLFLVGSTEDFDSTSDIFSEEVLAARLEKPLNIRELSDRLNREINGESQKDTVRILVVDDDSTMLHFIEKLLSPSYRVYLANSGESALSFLSNNSAELILLDIRMPNMDGFETIKRIRSLENCAEIPVVFLTANDDTEAEAKCLSAGAADFLRKPFLPEVLQLRVQNIIELDALRKSLSDEVEKKTAQVTLETQPYYN